MTAVASISTSQVGRAATRARSTVRATEMDDIVRDGYVIIGSPEEVAHKEEALASGAEQAPAYETLTRVIKTGSKLAIWLSTRI